MLQYVQTLPIVCDNKHVKFQFTFNLSYCRILAANLISQKINPFQKCKQFFLNNTRRVKCLHSFQKGKIRQISDLYPLHPSCLCHLCRCADFSEKGRQDCISRKITQSQWSASIFFFYQKVIQQNILIDIHNTCNFKFKVHVHVKFLVHIQSETDSLHVNLY